jgi:signal peptidase II
MRFGTRLAVLLMTMLGCVGCDQVSKSLVRAELQPGRSISLFGGALLLERAENSGAFLSAGESLSAGTREALFTVGGTALVLGAIAWAVFSRRLRLSGMIGAGLICGGGIGNLIDRFCHNGYVTDFLNVGVGAVRTGIFNIADFLLLLGLALAVHDGMAERH